MFPLILAKVWALAWLWLWWPPFWELPKRRRHYQGSLTSVLGARSALGFLYCISTGLICAISPSHFQCPQLDDLPVLFYPEPNSFFFFFLFLPVYCYQPISLHPRAHVLSHVIPWTSARQTPLSMDFSRQEYWSGLPFPSPPEPNSFILLPQFQVTIVHILCLLASISIVTNWFFCFHISL